MLHFNFTKNIQTNTKVQTSLKTDPLGEITAKLLDAEEECRQDIARMLAIQQEIVSLVEATPSIDCRLILYERYVNRKGWEKIAEDNHYSLKWVHVLHKRGLKAVEQQYTKVHCNTLS